MVELSDVEVISEDIPGWLVANEGSLTVALDITVSDELRREGYKLASLAIVDEMGDYGSLKFRETEY